MREGADGTICGPKRDARARVRTVIFEVATGKGRVVRGSLLAAHHGLHRALVSPAERAKTAPAFPAPAPNWFPGAEGIPLRGRKALFRKRGAVLGAREPHVVGRFDGSQTLDRRKPRRRRDDTKVRTNGAREKIESYDSRGVSQKKFHRCRPRRGTRRVSSSGRARSPPSSPHPSPLSLSLPFPPLPSPSLPPDKECVHEM